MRSRSRRRKQRTLATILVLLLTLAGCYFLWETTHTTSPALSLARGVELVKSKKLSEAESFLGVARRNPGLAHWAELYRAILAEKRGDLEEALNRYSLVSKDSAAWPDAKVGMLRVWADLTPEVQKAHQDKFALIGPVETLASELTLLRRSDLRAEFELLQARKLQTEERIADAFDMLLLVREKYPLTDAAKSARDLTAQLRVAFRDNPEFTSLKYRTREAQLLLNEKDPLRALEVVQEAQKTVAERSVEYFELKLLEEQILRKLSRPEEADRLLLVLAAEGGATTADRALLKVARNAWNINDNHRAVEFLGKLQERFPESKERDEALYVEARILEELESFVEAKDKYREIVNSARELDDKIRALRRLAWLNVRASVYRDAFTAFHEIVERTSDKPELTSDYLHARFWETYSLSKLDEPSRREIQKEAKTPEQLWEELAQHHRFGYYGSLAAKYSGRPPLQEPALKIACETELDADLEQRTKQLADADLPEFSEREVYWHFLRTAREPLEHFTNRERGSLQFPTSDLVQLASHATLIIRYAPRKGIELIRPVLRDLLASPNEKPDAQTCVAALKDLSYPVVYRDIIAQAAKSAGVPPALLFALIRTESHFDAKAESVVGAKGLAQLMPKTAAEEGLPPGGDLSDPRTNANLGAKHLSRLLRIYGNKQSYAIAAYNGGVSAVNRWNTRYGEIPEDEWIELIGYPETMNYVKEVLFAAEIYAKKNP